MDIQTIRALIHEIPDFPQPGILFRDITPVLADPRALRATVTHMAEALAPHRPEGIVAIESRGFLLGSALAMHMDLPLVLVRKPGKLPRPTQRVSYELEYGSDALEVHVDDVRADTRYAVVDDLIATGGTCRAAIELLRQRNAEVAVVGFLIELEALGGRARLDAPVTSLLLYS